MKKILLGIVLVSSMAMGAEKTNLYLKIGADIMYKINKSQIKVDAPNGSFKENLDYSRVTLSAGYKFNL